jgi:Mu-like prophage I protein
VNKPRDAIVACSHSPKTDAFLSSFAIAINDNEPPEWIELIPAGKFSAVDGRGPFENDDPDSIIAASVAKMPQVGLVLDYDHSTDLAAPEGRPAPAAGWLKQFKVEHGSILARIEWTADAAEAVKAKKYRYVSPVFEHSKEGKVERILRAALTNNPALINLPALARAENPRLASPWSGGGIGTSAHAEEVGESRGLLKPPPDQGDGREGVSGGVARMAKNEDKKMKLSEVMAVLEEAYPDAGPEKLMKAAACLIADDGDEDMHAADGDPYEDETEEQMAARQAEEMAKCASDGEREAMAKKHMAETTRFAERRDRNHGLEVKAEMADQKGDKSLQAAIAKHPMVLRMAGEMNQMRAAQAKASATEKS